MANNAKKDQNSVSTMIGASSADGQTIVLLQANPANHGMEISDGTGGTDYGTVNAKRDENNVPCLMAISSTDGVTPVAVYFTSDGKLLTQST